MADQNHQYLMNESDLPENLEFVERAALTTGSAAPPSQQGVDRYQGAILSAPLGLDTDIAKSQLPGANPAYRLMPPSIAGNPASNAAIQSTAAKTIAVTPGSSTTTSAEIELIMPSIFTPTDQTVTLPGPLVVGLATEAPGTYFSTPSSSLPSIENLVTGTFGLGASGSGALNLTVSPTTATSWGIYAAAYNGTLTTPSGFTAFGGGGAHASGYYGALSGTSPITISQTVAVNSTASGVFAVFAGSLPTLVQQAAATFVGVTPLNKAFTSNNTAGNTIIAIVTAINNTNGPFSLGVSDSAGNSYTTIGYVQGTGVWQPSVLIAIATNIAGGANTVHASITGTPAGGSTGTLQIIEYPALTAASDIPVFKPIISSDVPPINIGSSGNGGVSGILKPVNGGTGSDLSATGGASLFLSQLSAGANISPTQPDFSDLAGATGKLATKYNGISLISNGIPSEIKKIDLTTQNANIGATTFYSVPATGQQLYRVSAYIVETTADGVSSTLPTVQIVYTDFDSNTSVTIDATPVLAAAGLGQSGLLTANVIGTVATGTILINPKASTTVQYQTTGYLSGTPGAMQYAVHLKLEAL